jgi:hypothetical protein
MKQHILFLTFLFCAPISNAQSVSITIDGINYSIAKTEKDNTVSGEYRMNWIQIGAALPSKNKLGRYNSFGIYIYGKTVGTYPVGCCDKSNYNEPYENNISANWFDNNGVQQNISANQGEVERNSGKIIITQVDGNMFSGNFTCTISGAKIAGTFEKIPVKGLH